MLFDKKIEPSCSYCKRGAALGNDEIMCPRHGVVYTWSSCRHFRYDPLRRVPPRPQMPEPGDFEKKDFEL